LIRNYESVSSKQERIRLLLDAARGAFFNPERADLVSAVGDLTSSEALLKLEKRMLADPDGRQILLDRPRVTPETWDIDELLTLPGDTFGYHYANWMSKHHYSSDERPKVKYVPNLQHAYIIQRYKEVHDSIHVLLGYNTTVAEEVAVKWFEMVHTGLPLTAFSSFTGPLMLLYRRDLNAADAFFRVYLPHILENSQRQHKLYLNVYFERNFETKIDDLRKQIGIKPFVVR
jgi:ubiquinone biosynthesis protein COQ4